MARKAKSYYAVQPYKRDAISKVGLPEKVKCIRCGTIKGHHCFAQNRLNDLKEKVRSEGSRFNPTTNAYIVCSMCTGGQVTELHCCMCDKTKGLTAFSKAQRSKPDEAKCWPCMEQQLNTEPGGASSDEDSNSDDSDGSFYGGASTVAGTFSNLSIGNGDGSSTNGGVALDSGTYTSKASSSIGNSNGGVTVRNGSGTSTPRANYAASTTSSITTARTGINSNAGTVSGFKVTPPHLRRAPAASSTGSMISNPSTKFAKVKATPHIVVFEAARRQRETEKKAEDEITVQSSDDSDSD